MQASEPLLKAFAPIGSNAARLMILGSMPGAASLAEIEYYAHPRNAFWPVMQTLFGGSINTYADKCQILTDNHIVVWDVLTECIRPGSLDANIRRDSVVCNNFAAFLNKQTAVSQIAFNGKASQQLFRKHAMPDLDLHFTNDFGSKPRDQQASTEKMTRTIQLIALPSTSPAMASLNLDDKILAWSKALLQDSGNSQMTDNQV